MKTIILLLGVASLAVLPTANADPIYIETTDPNTATLSDADRPFYIANDFSPLIDGTITTVSWWGMYFGASSTPQAIDDFTINFYSDAGGPGALLNSFNVGNSVNRTGTGDFFISGTEFYGYEATIGAGLDVLLGSTYWVSIFNDTSVDLDDNWYWATNTNETHPSGTRQNSSNLSSWSSGSSAWPYVFELHGAETITVPEPGTLALFGIGLAVMGLARRRKIA